jgi:hypothetical protein
MGRYGFGASFALDSKSRHVNQDTVTKMSRHIRLYLAFLVYLATLPVVSYYVIIHIAIVFSS